MGNRVHVVSKQCRYGDTEAFNWKAEEFANFLSACDVSVSTNYDYDYSQFEVEAEEYKKALVLLKKIEKAGDDVDKIKKLLDKAEIYDYDYFMECLEDTDCTVSQMYKIMKSFWDERDKKSGWIEFHSW